jgi:hypothetical protein
MWYRSSLNVRQKEKLLLPGLFSELTTGLEPATPSLGILSSAAAAVTVATGAAPAGPAVVIKVERVRRAPLERELSR